MQILPNGVAWIPNLVKTITDVVLGRGKSIFVNKKMVDGPNPNNRGKILIPFILAFQVSSFFAFLSMPLPSCDSNTHLTFCVYWQYFFVFKRIQGMIKDDIRNEPEPDWA